MFIDVGIIIDWFNFDFTEFCQLNVDVERMKTNNIAKW